MAANHTPDHRPLRPLVNAMLNGYADARDRTPWKRAPMTEDECRYVPETDEQQAYWEGWYSGVLDRVRPVFAAAASGGHSDDSGEA